MYKLKIILFASIFFAFVLGLFSQRHTMQCELMTPFGYTEVAPKVFVSPSISMRQSSELLSLIDLAKSRINTTFGKMLSSPKVIFTATKNEATNLGSNENGAVFLSPLGQCIVLGPKGQNIDVIAHEYTHAEVHHRVGWLTYLLSVPTWFNEGIATLVDYRQQYLLENINLPQDEVNSIKSKTFDFSKVGHYQAARVLAEEINKSQLYDDLEKLTQGQSISAVFEVLQK